MIDFSFIFQEIRKEFSSGIDDRNNNIGGVPDETDGDKVGIWGKQINRLRTAKGAGNDDEDSNSINNRGNVQAALSALSRPTKEIVIVEEEEEGNRKRYSKDIPRNVTRAS